MTRPWGERSAATTCTSCPVAGAASRQASLLAAALDRRTAPHDAPPRLRCRLLNQAGEHAAGLGAAAFVLHDLHAACLLRTRSYERALAEAELCTQLQESWWVGGRAGGQGERPLPEGCGHQQRSGGALPGMPGCLTQLQRGAPPSCAQLPRRRPRGWARVGAALLALGQYEAALAAYNDALGWSSGSPSEEVVRGRELAQRAVEDYGCAKYH